MNTDPIADLLTRIRNAGSAGHATLSLPSSKLKVEILRVLKDEGYIESFDVSANTEGPGEVAKVKLKYRRGGHVITGIERKSTPGQRVYVRGDAVPNVLNGMGISILTTSLGVITGREAKARGVGGEYICAVW